jgi:hypothetical protein
VVGEEGFGQQAVRDVLREVVVHRQLLRMTWRSLSTSPSRSAGDVSTSPRSSTASGRCSAGTRL